MNNLLKILIIIVVLSGCKSLKTTTINDKFYYQIINDKVKRSIQKDYSRTIAYINNNVNFSKDKKEQLLKLVERKKKEKRNYVFYKQDNEFLIESLKKSLIKKGDIFKYFGKKKTQKMLLSFGKESKLKQSKLDSNFVISKNEYWHKFSAPIKIDNQIIVYHYKKTTDNYTDRIFVYEIEDNQIKPKRKFFSLVSKPCKEELFVANDKNYYAIINGMVLRDSVRYNKRLNLYKNKEKNQIYLEQFKKKLNYIFIKNNNKTLINYIENNIQNGGYLLNYFCEEQLKLMVHKLKEEDNKEIDKNKLNAKIKIANSYFGHAFSSPIIIGNTILLFHINRKDKYDFTSEIFIYKIKDNKIDSSKRLYGL